MAKSKEATQVQCSICDKVCDSRGFGPHNTRVHQGKGHGIPLADNAVQPAPAKPAEPAGTAEPIDTDELIAVACEMMTVLGMQRVEAAEARWFINPDNGRAVKLTDAGLVFKAELRIVTS